MKYIYIIISFLIISSCKKDTNQPSAKNFVIGQKFANGIIWSLESADDISRPTNMPNYNLLIIGLNDYTDLTFSEAREKVISLRDEFGEWNYQNLNYFQDSPSLEDSSVSNEIIFDLELPILFVTVTPIKYFVPLIKPLMGCLTSPPEEPTIKSLEDLFQKLIVSVAIINLGL